MSDQLRNAQDWSTQERGSNPRQSRTPGRMKKAALILAGLVAFGVGVDKTVEHFSSDSGPAPVGLVKTESGASRVESSARGNQDTFLGISTKINSVLDKRQRASLKDRGMAVLEVSVPIMVNDSKGNPTDEVAQTVTSTVTVLDAKRFGIDGLAVDSSRPDQQVVMPGDVFESGADGIALEVHAMRTTGFASGNAFPATLEGFEVNGINALRAGFGCVDTGDGENVSVALFEGVVTPVEPPRED